MHEMTLKAFEDFLLKMVAKKKTHRKVLYPLPTLQQRIECTVCQKVKMLEFTIQGCIILLIYLDVFYTSSPFIAHCRSVPYLST